jgi:hypothetical protein
MMDQNPDAPPETLKSVLEQKIGKENDPSQYLGADALQRYELLKKNTSLSNMELLSHIWGGDKNSATPSHIA